MKSLSLAIVAAAALATTAHAQDSGTAPASSGSTKNEQNKSPGSSQAQVGERAPGDASSSTSQEGRPRAGIEVGTASATQGGRTDNGTPPRQGATDRSSTPTDRSDTANNSAHRAARQGATEDKEFNRVPDQGATMMTKDQQKKEAAAAKKRGKSRKDKTAASGKHLDAPNPEAADTSTSKNRKE
jgi:hypothetical protein